MKTIYILLLFMFLKIVAFATGEPSTYFNIFVPPNNDAVNRNVCLIVTAIYDSTTFSIVDDGMDGDTDDSFSGMLMAGQSYILYIKDNGINDDAATSSSTGTLKQDGDYFIINSNKLVYASQSTDSDWQHDWLPSVNKKSIGEKFLIYAPKITSSLRDVNVFAYEDSTLVKIKKISLISKMVTGYTVVDMKNPVTVSTFILNRGEDIIYKYAFGRNTLLTGETYLIESSKPVTVQYGALIGNERDGGGYVPSANGSSSGELFYFAVPYQAVGEQEIRIVSWDNTNAVKLERYSNGSWITMRNWTLNRFQPADWVGKSNGNVSYPTVFRVTCTAGKNVSIFEGNWFETGSPGTSDMATMVSADNGTSSGRNFLTYMAPPGNEQNVLNPFTGQKFNQRLTHLYFFCKKTANVTVKDAYTNGTKLNRTYTIQAGRYVDCFLTETEWKNIYNGTGTTAGGPERPYLVVTSDEDISVMNTNFNDNWMMYFGSALPQSILQTSTSSENSASPGETITFTSAVVLEGNSDVTNAQVDIFVSSGAVVQSSNFIDVTNSDTIAGTINQTNEGALITYDSIPVLTSSNQYEIQTDLYIVPVNDGSTNINNTIVNVESVVTGTVDGNVQQSVVNEGIQIQKTPSVDVTPPSITAPPSIQTDPNASGCTASVNLGTPVTSDNVGVIYITNNAPANFPIGTTTVTWLAYDQAGNSASATQTVIVNSPVVTTPNVGSSSICSGNSTTLSLNETEGTYEWYPSLSGNTLLHVGISYTTPILNNSVTYFVLKNVNGCKSEKVPFVLTVKTTPAEPTVNVPLICSGNTVTLNAVVPSGDVRWLDSNSVLVASVPSYTTPVLQKTSTYYVYNIANGCIGALKTLNLTVTPTPTAPSVANENICIGSTLVMQATGPGGTYQWFSQPVNGSLIHTGATYTNANLIVSKDYFIQTTINGCVSARTKATATVSTRTPDDISPHISGVVLLCKEANLTYTCGPAHYATSYQWTVPTGMQIISGNTTRTIQVNVDTTKYVTGQISVIPVNACGVGNTRYLDINLSTTIAGLDEVCQVSNTIYSVHPVLGASSYTWTLPSGVSGTSNTNSIYVTISSDFTEGDISVQAFSSCSNSVARSRKISALINMPSVISGESYNICPSSTKVFSVVPNGKTTSYTWIAPTGAKINNLNTNVASISSNEVTISFPENFTEGQISVRLENGCHYSVPRIKYLSKFPSKSSPSPITGITNVCGIKGTSQVVNYSIDSVSGVTNYLWTLPSKTTLVSGQGTKTIGVRFDADFNAGTFKVESVGLCANSKFRALGVYQSPGVVSMINGPTSICELQGNTVTYTIPAVSDATGYVWMVPSSATIVSGQNTTSLQVQFGNTINGSDKIRVRAKNSCGASMIRVMEFSPCASSNFMASGNTSITSSEIQINGFYLSENESSMNISFESVSDTQVIYEFYNLLGQCVFSEDISLVQGITSVKSDLSYLQTGMYQIVVKTHEDKIVTTSYFIK